MLKAGLRVKALPALFLSAQWLGPRFVIHPGLPDWIRGLIVFF
jgi:hypothetical protein